MPSPGNFVNEFLQGISPPQSSTYKNHPSVPNSRGCNIVVRGAVYSLRKGQRRMMRNARTKPIGLAKFPGGTRPRKRTNKPKKCPKMGFAAFPSTNARIAENKKRTQIPSSPGLPKSHDGTPNEKCTNKPNERPDKGLAAFGRPSRTFAENEKRT